MKFSSAIISAALLLLGGQECWSWLAAAGTSDLGVSQAEVEALVAAVGAGFRHIVPEGLDHIAFLLGLFFLSRHFPTLLLQVTLFTLAHSLTLGVVVTTGLAVPSQWVEVAVGLSIAAVALENFFPAQLQKLRLWLIALFGCIHGLAFAHNLVLLPVAQANPISALFGFNLGVELGQLTVIGTAYLLLCPWWSRVWYERRIVLPASVAIACIGLAWAIQRTF
jgi:hypothetical protein